jgi:hypothetical protein
MAKGSWPIQVLVIDGDRIIYNDVVLAENQEKAVRVAISTNEAVRESMATAEFYTGLFQLVPMFR